MTDLPTLSRDARPPGEEDLGSDRTVASKMPTWARALTFGNISAVYVLGVVLIGFAIWVPTFYEVPTLKTLLYQPAVTTIVAIALLIPLSAAVYDLSVGATVGMSSVVLGWSTVVHGQPILMGVLLALGVGVLIGLVNGFLIVACRIESLIATLATASALAALGVALSGNVQITGIPLKLQEWSTAEFRGIAAPFFLLIILCLIVWYAMEHTAPGRALYATGGNREAARLAGVRTNRVIWLSLIASGLIASLAGIIVTARVAVGDPNVGPPFLLPAFGAAFLGATQIKKGQFNVWGTVIATYVLAAGVKGLQLGGAPLWLPDLFNGVALALAVGLSTYERRSKVGSTGARGWRFSRVRDAR